MHTVGYADRLSLQPGKSIRFMVSSHAKRYRADVVRLVHGDVNPRGPGFKHEPVDSALAGEYAGRVQELRNGSYLRVPGAGAFATTASFTVQLWIWPTTPELECQTLLSAPGCALRLRAGRLELEVDGGAVAVERTVEPRTWYFVAATYDAEAQVARLLVEPPAGTTLLGDVAVAPLAGARRDAGDREVLLAAEWLGDGAAARVERFYNGKLEAPRVYGRALADEELAALRDGGAPTALAGLHAAWDFSVGIPSRDVTDVSDNGLHGRTVNMPARGMTGHAWSGRETAWPHAPQEYGAIHFHDDDLDDAGWEADFAWTVPDDLPSGVYAVHLDADGGEDYVPFFVRPKRGRPSARIALLIPTFSYLAYANMARPEDPDILARIGIDAETLAGYPVSPHERYAIEHRLRSLYGSHSDGSGVCYSSRLRPIVNMRPKCADAFLEGGPHQFNADLCIVDWLTEQDYRFDVVTDEDLHAEGRELLAPYRAVLTGTHCEYWSEQMLDGALGYLRGGGRLMYLAGNGMYWVTQLDPEERHTVEVRRRGPATRFWEPEPGEAHLSTTGELGGVWRFRGRSPQSWLGVGFSAVGEGPGRPYERLPDSFDPRAAFVFEGIGDDELIGDFPSLVNSYGAAGFELDRVDHRLGTPRHTLVLASATGFSDRYHYVVDEVFTSHSGLGGSVNPRVRADMVLLEYPNGGAMFSPGSIQWSGSLSHDGYDNNVSRVTRNVLDRFASDDPPC